MTTDGVRACCWSLASLEVYVAQLRILIWLVILR